jgi:hypothetical protein
MQKLIELEISVSKLSDAEYAEFREWFSNYENERWDTQLAKDIKEKRLEDLANKALKDFKQGESKEIS